MLDTGYWILDTGYWILVTGYPFTPETGVQNLDIYFTRTFGRLQLMAQAY
ncbi:MAG: hypothetical protein ISR62_02500 [Desulfobacteraceae bacterium]|nr:hypothetical protein [Desulfobacteraceae bacterium]MBL7102546.1 hypothetical protein [Desulfobacteraceae bacterium]MBL7172738.1 hypothetical protein [Desulfobacteraceae bacterium]